MHTSKLWTNCWKRLMKMKRTFSIARLTPSLLLFISLRSLIKRNTELELKNKTLKLKVDEIRKKVSVEVESALRSKLKAQRNELEKLEKENESYRRRIQQMRYNQLAKKAVQSEAKRNLSSKNRRSNKKRVYSEVVTVTPPKKKYKNNVTRAITQERDREIESNEASPAIIRTTLTTPNVEDSKTITKRVVKSAPALRRPQSRSTASLKTSYKYAHFFYIRARKSYPLLIYTFTYSHIKQEHHTHTHTYKYHES